MSKDERKEIKATLIKNEDINKMFMTQKGHQNIQSTNGQIDFFVLVGSSINDINQRNLFGIFHFKIFFEN